MTDLAERRADTSVSMRVSRLEHAASASPSSPVIAGQPAWEGWAHRSLVAGDEPAPTRRSRTATGTCLPPKIRRRSWPNSPRCCEAQARVGRTARARCRGHRNAHRAAREACSPRGPRSRCPGGSASGVPPSIPGTDIKANSFQKRWPEQVMDLGRHPCRAGALRRHRRAACLQGRSPRRKPAEVPRTTLIDRIDRVVMHPRAWGYVIFFVVMALIFLRPSSPWADVRRWTGSATAGYVGWPAGSSDPRTWLPGDLRTT